MRFRSPGMRRLALIWAAVQFAAAGVTTLAHARVGLDDAAVAHVEAASGETCPVVHPLDCGVCRHAGTTQLPACVSAQDLATGTSAEIIPSELPVFGRLLEGLHDGRAPPVG